MLAICSILSKSLSVTSLRTKLIVAIDGPAGAGKSTVAKALARSLGYVLVDTGAMYRTLSLASKEQELADSDEDGIAALGNELLASGALKFMQSEDGIRVMLGERDVSSMIRTPEAALGASIISKHPKVRQVLLGLQRKTAEHGGVVLEGRDIGTVVCPDAEVKFYLTARPEIRAERRFQELREKGKVVTLEETLRDVKARDDQDQNRAIAPLKPAQDAVIIDSSDWDLAQTIAEMQKVITRASHVNTAKTV
jgi:CMP/dCMP kinase